MRQGEGIGVLAAVLSSSLGGVTTAVTRQAMGAGDPVTLAALRFGIGFLLLLPVALALASPWPRGRDWIGVGLLGVLFFAIFMGLFNWALAYTTAARGALALSVLPLMTMAMGAALGIEPLGARKAAGVLLAMAGVAAALLSGLEDAPAGAWRGDGLMIVGTLFMAFYNVWSRPFIARSGALAFLTAGMGAGAAFLLPLAAAGGGLGAAVGWGGGQWAAVVYLGVVGGALTFFLWVFALARTTPTRVANTITLNPVTATIMAAILLGEPAGLDLAAGIAGVFAGIWVASTEGPVLTQIAAMLSARRAARQLAGLDDRLLRDVGLRRSGGGYVEHWGSDIVAPMPPPSPALHILAGLDGTPAAGRLSR